MAELSRTPLYDLHQSLGAKMVPFAGYEMPVQYTDGVLKEHLWTRSNAGLFDVSHMGQIWIEGDDPARALEKLLPQSVVGLAAGRQRYGFLTNEDGGIIDDLMIQCADQSRLQLVVNAAGKHAVLDHLKQNLPDHHVEPYFDAALLAVQGPAAEAALSAVAPECADMKFMDVRRIDSAFGPLEVSRSGYTGEDGFEVSVAASQSVPLAEALLAIDDVAAVGLGARDSLRLEAGLCLHGSDIDATTTPVEAALEWAIQKVRRRGGDREGGFPGASVILEQLEKGASRRRVGLKPEGRAPMRAGTEIYAGDARVGTVTSGAFGPTLEGPMSMGYVDTAFSKTGTKLTGEVRGKRLPLSVAETPFTPANYKR